MFHDKNLNSKMLEDILTDYANENGDAWLIEQITLWLEKKMSGNWTVSKKEKSALEVISTIREKIHDMNGNTPGYYQALSDVLQALLEELANL